MSSSPNKSIKDYFRQRPWILRGTAAEGFSEETLTGLILELREKTGLSELTLKLCVSRGMKTAEEIARYLSPSFDALTPPLRIKDMDRAVERLARAREAGEKVLIYGDYDVDGTSGAALLVWIFRDMGFQFEALQPDRFKDGYGLNIGAVRDAAARGVKLLVTVDCGITSFDAAAEAKALGVDLVVVDHHQIDPVRGLPQAVAVVNPQRADCESGLRQLCGCGLAFYVAIALRSHGRAAGWFAAGKEPNLKQHLDLVVLATAADMVPLIGDNRILVSHGMEILRNTKKPGLRALMDVAGIFGKTVSPGNLGFVLGPRINASGRMQSASLALELLTTADNSKAYEMARTLEQLNTDRAEIQNQIWDDVRAKVEKGIAAGLYPNGIVIGDAGWHEGVVGIVASRVTETFRRPAAVIALKEGGHGKGSVRSYGGKDILAALREAKDFLLGFGGHRFAAGLSLNESNLDEVNRIFNEALAKITVDANVHALTIEGECNVEDLNVRTLEELEKLAPFGPGNPEPIYAIHAKVDTHRVLKGRHLKLRLKGETSVVNPAKATGPEENAGLKFLPRSTPSLDAIWFHAAEREDIMDVLGDPSQMAHSVRWAGIPELNRYDGRTTPSFRLKDWKPEPIGNEREN